MAHTLTASRSDVEAILGRPERILSFDQPLTTLANRRVLVTGAAGSLGSALVPLLRESGIPARATDLDDTDVRDAAAVEALLRDHQPEMIFHLAGAKHAPAGEEDPLTATLTNVVGTQNVLAHMPDGCLIVTASTCKAANPETAYGATKLIAERLTLNAGGTVARFYNVVESQENVFEIWAAIPESDPVPVTPCLRYFLSLREAVGLLLWAAIMPPGRYTLHPGGPRSMLDVAAALYPERPVSTIYPRRGDRLQEPRQGSHEVPFQTEIDGLLAVRSQHDPLYPGEIPVAG